MMYLPHVWGPDDEWIVIEDSTRTIVDDDEGLPGAADPGARTSGVEFVAADPSGLERPFRAYNDAARFAVGLAASTGTPMLLDVRMMSRDRAAEQIEVRAESVPRR